MGNTYIDNLEEELKLQGIRNDIKSDNNISNSTRDYDLKTILEMEQATRIKYSEEQKEVLMYRGNACIIACAGSGKTTTSTHLIAKRIKTGEIADPSKLIYTTYSKAGATEMNERLTVLLKQLGLDCKVEVRTLHAFFLKVLRTFGVTADIIKSSRRTSFIKEACKDVEFQLKDDDLMTLDNLLSFQVNNLLTDKKTIECYVNTLDTLTLEQYSAIRQGYSQRKVNEGLIDYDDMQSYLYLWLVKFAKSEKPEERKVAQDVRQYCQAMYTDFYVDEAQDVSEIQFAILRGIVTNPDNPDKLVRNLMFIGDDDQCLASYSLVEIEENINFIENIQVGNKILTATGNSETKYEVVDKVSSKDVHGNFIDITTESDLGLRGTPEHLCFAKLLPNRNCFYTVLVHHLKEISEINEKNYSIHFTLETISGELDYDFEYNNADKLWIVKMCDYFEESEQYIQRLEKYGILKHGYEFLEDLGLNSKYPHLQVEKPVYKINTKFTDIEFDLMPMGNLLIGMIIPVIDCDYKATNDIVIKAERVYGEETVYDLSVPRTKNFVANNIVVHNCIYTWRGSNPSIILSMSPLFDIRTLVLSTNYRCKSNIVNYATTGIKCNNSRYKKGMTANEKGGNVKILPSAKQDLCALSKLAENHIKYWIKQGESLKDIAVLSRNNFHLAILSNILLRDGIYCDLSNDMKLTKNYMYLDVKALLELCSTSWKSEILPQILWKLCAYMSRGTCIAIANFQKNSGLSIIDTLGWIVKKFIDNSVQFDKKLCINKQAEEKLLYHISRLGQETKQDLVFIYNTLLVGEQGNKEECFKLLSEQFLFVCDYLYKQKDKKRSIVGIIEYIKDLIKQDSFDETLNFLKMTEQFENGSMGVVGEKVTLSTIHSAKGREWKNVIMFACDNISQPSLDSIGKMIDEGTQIHDIYKYIDEERRLFYVGNTRAKENLLVITYNQPSIFILEALGQFSLEGKKKWPYGNEQNAFEQDQANKEQSNEEHDNSDEQVYNYSDDFTGNNSTVLSVVNDTNYLRNFQDIINEKIKNPDSPYYYDIQL